MKVLFVGREMKERMTTTIVEVCENGMFRDIPILYVMTAFMYDFRTNRN
jgi:hypothetical protein